MIRYTVTWHPRAQDELTELWLEATDRAAIAESADTIDTQLASDPDRAGVAISDRSRELSITPLHVLFRVSSADRMVEIYSVTRDVT
jgi:hypothetical protein